MRFHGRHVAIPVVIDQVSGLRQAQLWTRQGCTEQSYGHIHGQIGSTVKSGTRRLTSRRVCVTYGYASATKLM